MEALALTAQPRRRRNQVLAGFGDRLTKSARPQRAGLLGGRRAPHSARNLLQVSVSVFRIFFVDIDVDRIVTQFGFCLGVAHR